MTTIRGVYCLTTFPNGNLSEQCQYLIHNGMFSGNVSNAYQASLVTGLKILSAYGQAVISSSFIQICTYSFVSYEISKEFKRYLSANFDSGSPPTFLSLSLISYKKIREILDNMNSLNSFTFGSLILYGIVGFSKYLYEMVTTTNGISESNIMDGLGNFMFWLTIVFAAEANSNVS